MSNDLFTTSIIKRETTEDGDVCFTYEVIAKGVDGINAFNETQRHPIRGWEHFKEGGFFKATFWKTVDGAEIAIEARNDAWASHQQAIEDAGRELWWFH